MVIGAALKHFAGEKEGRGHEHRHEEEEEGSTCATGHSQLCRMDTHHPPIRRRKGGRKEGSGRDRTSTAKGGTRERGNGMQQLCEAKGQTQALQQANCNGKAKQVPVSDPPPLILRCSRLSNLHTTSITLLNHYLSNSFLPHAFIRSFVRSFVRSFFSFIILFFFPIISFLFQSLLLFSDFVHALWTIPF